MVAAGGFFRREARNFMLVVIGVFQDSVAADNAEPDDAASAESTKNKARAGIAPSPRLCLPDSAGIWAA